MSRPLIDNNINPKNTADNLQNADSCYSENEDISDKVLNALNYSLIFFDNKGVIYRANLMAGKELHLSTELTGSKLTDILDVVVHNKEVLKDLLARFEDPGTEQVSFPQDALIRTHDRKNMFFASGNITRLYGDRFLFSFRNVVEELTQEYMLKMALSSTKIFPWFYDFERNAMIIEPRYYEYTGIPTTDYTMTMEEFNDRIHPEDRAAMTEAFTLQLNGIHYPYPVPFRLRRGDDTYEWFEGQSTYLGQVEGMPYRVVGICMSTQAFKNIEAALTAAKNKAEQSDRLKSAFLANMSHEIRTPLNAIVGFSNLLAGQEANANNSESKEYAALISKNCDYLLTLVSDILDLSRIETGTMEYIFAKHSLRALLSEIYSNHEDRIPEGVKFTLLLPVDDIEIETDSERLRQAIDNLLSNSEKFTTKGQIDVGYSLSSDGESVRIFVSDTGRGIPLEQCEKIFERFYKVDSFVQGAGLGLSLCKTLTENLGGQLSVWSYPDEGSRFTIRLPIEHRKDNIF